MGSPEEKYADALRAIVINSAPAKVVAEYVLERLPYVFADDWTSYRKWRSTLGDAIGVDPCNISLVGSACVGASLNPIKKVSPFTDESDIDVAIISDFHFESAWRTLRALPLASTQTSKDRSALKQHQDHFIYWGCIAADKVIRFLPFAKKWIIAMSAAAAMPPTHGREIKFRIYKDYDALRSYQILGVKILRSNLLEPK